MGREDSWKEKEGEGQGRDKGKRGGEGGEDGFISRILLAQITLSIGPCNLYDSIVQLELYVGYVNSIIEFEQQDIRIITSE